MVEVDDIMPEQMIAFSGESSDDVMITGADDGDDDRYSCSDYCQKRQEADDAVEELCNDVAASRLVDGIRHSINKAIGGLSLAYGFSCRLYYSVSYAEHILCNRKT